MAMASPAIDAPLTDDLALLSSLDDESTVTFLERRFRAKDIYTHVNQMLVALNPYTDLGLYTDEALRLYSRVGTGGPRPPPHAFGIAAEAFSGLLAAQSQSVLVTGESGSGKTETCRRLLQYLAYAATLGGSGETRKLHEALGLTSCVLEAFGNARTAMNDNSSRYGKFLTLRYDGTARLRGAAFSTFLLEKTRVVRPAPGSRNFHIFYALLAGLSPTEAADLFLVAEAVQLGATLKPLGATAFRYARVDAAAPGTGSSPAAMRAEAARDKATLREIGRALETLGLAPYDQWQAWRVLGATLHLGNVAFDTDLTPRGGEADTAEVRPGPSAAALEAAASLLGLPLEALSLPLKVAPNDDAILGSRSTWSLPNQTRVHPNRTRALLNRTLAVSKQALSAALLTRCIRAGPEFISTPNGKGTAAG